MTQRRLTGIYSYWEVADELPIRLLGPGMKRYCELSRALSKILNSAPRRSDALRLIEAFVWALNRATDIFSDAAERVERAAIDCTETIFAFLKAVGANSRKDRQGQDRYWVSPELHNYGKVERALAGFAAVTEHLAPRVYGGVDPSRVDIARHAPLLSYNGKFRRDTGRRFRLVVTGNRLPRSNDPRIYDRWIEAARELRVDALTVWIARICRFAGCRFVSAQNINLADLLVFAESFSAIPAVSKGSRGKRVLTLKLPPQMAKELEAYVASAFPRYYKLWKERRLPSASRLAKVPLFTLDGITPYPYGRYHRQFVSAAAKAGLTFRTFEEGAEEVHVITPQQLRHEYVFHRLLAIEPLTPAEKRLHRDAIADYLGWSSGEAMLDYYSHFYAQLNALALAQRAFEEVEREPDGNQAGGQELELADLMDAVS